MSGTTNQLTKGAGEDREQKKTARLTTKNIVCMGMFAAILAVLSQISIPMPSGVPILSWKLGTGSTLVYILLGAVGAPVFAGFSGGAQVLVNYTGGFIWGFIAMTFLCGIGILRENRVTGILTGLAGLLLCHVFGVIQFMIVMKMGWKESFLLASAPYVIKDILSVILAFVVGAQIRARLLKAGLL